MSVGGGKRDVSSVAVTHQHGFATDQKTDKIADLSIHRERAGMRGRPAVTPAVVTQHPEVGVESPAELQHSG